MANLTTAQLQTLLPLVKADATTGPMVTAGDTFSLLAYLNGTSATSAWREAVPAQNSDEAAVYTTYDSLLQGKRDSWQIFLMFPRDFSKNKIRAWVTDVWGAATAASISEGILQAGTEKATNAQVLLGGTTPNTGTVAALKRVWSGTVSQQDANYLVNN